MSQKVDGSLSGREFDEKNSCPWGIEVPGGNNVTCYNGPTMDKCRNFMSQCIQKVCIVIKILYVFCLKYIWSILKISTENICICTTGITQCTVVVVIVVVEVCTK